MDFYIFVFLEYYWNLFSGNLPLNVIFTLGVIIVVWLFLRFMHLVATVDSGIHYVTTERQFLNVVTNHIPFVFNANYDTASYSGIKCTVTSRIPCYIQALWGVPIEPLFELLSNGTEMIRNAINTSDSSQMFSKYCIHCHPSELIAANEEKVYDFKPKDNIEAEILAKVTERRDIYPFVLLIVMRDEEQHIDSYVVAMASVIHISDRLFKHSPHLIGQFVKLSSGDIKEVKTIYHPSTPVTDDEGKQTEFCLVCCNKLVSMVYLPCRHACVCSDCIKLCEKCPVCRAFSTGYFQLSNS